ncbi:replication-associated recombination protein A [Alicyclobacillus contaminans]|uniref:replication-associated recombination protein A n=1 Tax=Alicyclobacillus contaminans TaxID=392016 RepID=UPI00041EA46E|nr:replication-associated recombination protein A [Alicyclobacillus contaminans]
MDLFDFAAEAEQAQEAPLAHRMRPETLDDLVGQQSVVGPGTPLRSAIERDLLMSVILYGPPGTGKTSLAHVIAQVTKARFETLNAVTAGIADIRQVVQRASDEKSMYGRKTVLFIDEIHRFNKTQQDALLPYVEQGTLVLIGATTENPYFQVNPALVSRSSVYRLDPLQPSDIEHLLRRALQDESKGLGAARPEVEDAALQLLVQASGGDARRALNSLEMAVLTAPVGPDGRARVTPEHVRAALQGRAVLYDTTGDEHYDTISAFIKSVRGSDPDAAILWLAKMLEAGEDPRFIARRLVILASEDIGNADPAGLPMAVAALQAVQFIGMPEARIVLAQATTYLACAPKSNAAYNAINRALSDVQGGLPLQVPPHLRGTGYAGAAELGSGVGYIYPHDDPELAKGQSYWPVGVERRAYYEPKPHERVQRPAWLARGSSGHAIAEKGR